MHLIFILLFCLSGVLMLFNLTLFCFVCYTCHYASSAQHYFWHDLISIIKIDINTECHFSLCFGYIFYTLYIVMDCATFSVY